MKSNLSRFSRFFSSNKASLLGAAARAGLLLGVSAAFLGAPATVSAAPADAAGTVTLQLRKRSPEGEVSIKPTPWKVEETAIIVGDMWDTHWCTHAAARVNELAPAVNTFLNAARAKGIKIVHAPSECMGFYKNFPARHNLLRTKLKMRNRWYGWGQGGGSEAPLPIADSSSGSGVGCPECKDNDRAPYPWRRQHASIEIKNNDYITDGDKGEILGFLSSNNIKNVLFVGVHTNMCLLGRASGMRHIRGFLNAALVRDLTDCMYNNPKGEKSEAPGVDHWAGQELINKHIETWIGPSFLSSDITGRKSFRFREDNRPQEKR
ncbi:MAG: hypothetical protein LBT53_00435 [Puniceicoccales bacterium]|nr:hypothetical protein [Puniceicoccales bacterium]